MRLIGILGGTFDPIHRGHICLALEAHNQLKLAQVRLIPLNIPAHRTIPIASTAHRQAMLELAIEDIPELCVDLREVDSDEVSYTINTLKSLRQEFNNDALCLILGKDAFNKIDTWKDWQSLLDYAHIIVANRPGESNDDISPELKSWVAQHQTNDNNVLNTNLNGSLFFIDIPMLDISSSMIRNLITEQKTINHLLPSKTLSYIKGNKLYLDTA